MSNYIMPPRSRASDYSKAVLTQNEYISLQIANDANIAKARQAVKQGVPALLTPQQTATTDELVMDDATNEAAARSNIEKIGFRPQEATTIIGMMRLNGLRWVDLNANFPSILADVKKRFDIKLLTPTFFVEYLRQYFRELAGAVGLTAIFQPYGEAQAAGAGGVNPGGGAFNAMINNVDELRQIIPEVEQIRILQDFIARTGSRTDRGVKELLADLEALRTELPSDADYRAIKKSPAVQQNRDIRDILQRFNDLPSRDEIAAMIRGMQPAQGKPDMDAIMQGVRELINSAPRGGSGSSSRREPGGASGVEAPPDPGAAEAEAEAALEEQIRQADILRQKEFQADIDARQYIEKERERGEKQRSGEYKYQSYTDKNTGRTTSVLMDTTTGKPVKDLPLPTGLALVALNRLKPKGSVDLSSVASVKDLTGLVSSTALSNATLADIKATFQAHPQLIPRLVDLTSGKQVNYNDLTKTKTNNARKTQWSDTNIKDLFIEVLGSGLHKKKFSAVPKLGKGLAVQETPSYRLYGKYAIHMPQLEQHNLLNVKYKSLGQIPKFKTTEVSDILKDFIVDLLDHGKPNQRVYQQIPQQERKLFEEMSIGSGIWSTLGLKRTTTSDDEEENKRFEILKGEYLSGNNNPKLITDLRRLVVKMISDGRIRKSQGMSFLMELSV